MRKVLSQKPKNERQIVNELLALADKYESNLLDGWTIQFCEWPHGHVDHGHKVLAVPSIDFMVKMSGEEDADIIWEKYWSIPIHELAHVLDGQWFPGNGPSATGHNYTFYAIMMALCMHLDLPFWSFEKYEIEYQPKFYKGGKSLAADMILDYARSINSNPQYCDDRTIYETVYCRKLFGRCIVHNYTFLRRLTDRVKDFFRGLGR